MENGINFLRERDVYTVKADRCGKVNYAEKSLEAQCGLMKARQYLNNARARKKSDATSNSFSGACR